MDTKAKANRLQQLHQAPEILRMVNVWDAISTKVISDLPETKAIATAGHSIAASHGFKDGTIPLDEALAALRKIVAATDHPVTADLDDGFSDSAEAVRQAIGIGIVGANIEDRLKPLSESVKVMEAAVKAGEAEGVAFQLNARTDAIVRGGDKPLQDKLADAIERGRAYLDVGAALVFVPGVLDREATQTLVEGLGRGKLSVIGLPGALRAAEYEELGVARITYGPTTQRHALTALKRLAGSLYGDGVIPLDDEALN